MTTRRAVWLRFRGPRPRLSGYAGQAAWEVVLVTLVLVAGFWGVGWAAGGEGVVALLLDAVRSWQQRYATVLALPI